jgi:hypothetical protein
MSQEIDFNQAASLTPPSHNITCNFAHPSPYRRGAQQTVEDPEFEDGVRLKKRLDYLFYVKQFFTCDLIAVNIKRDSH